MALVHSSNSSLKKDDSEEQMNYYVHNVMAAKDMMRLMKTRLHLVRANEPKHRLSVPRSDVTDLEHELMQWLRLLQKRCMNRQLLNIALQKSIQSSMLHAESRNLFTAKRLSYIEDSVAQQMKIMVEKSQLIRTLKEEVGLQLVTIAQLEDKLLGREIYQHERLSESSNLNTSCGSREKTNKITKTFKNINKLGSLLTVLVNVALKDKMSTLDEKKELVMIAVRWSAPRSPKYY